MNAQRIELNGAPASIDDLRAIALVNYGHFTSMQAEQGCVRGLDLHLARLDRATRELFGCGLDMDAVRAYLRHAIDGDRAASSLRVNVFARDLDRDHPIRAARPDVLVTAGPARRIPTEPLRLRSVRYQREAPHLKHVGTFGLFHQRRLAQAQGYDDALFVDASGAISEGSIWNIGFFDGKRVVWPNAAQLDGVSMQLLKAGLRERGVAQVERCVELSDVAAFRAAFLTNSSCFARSIARIDEVDLALDTGLPALLEDAWASRPLQRI
ncbi:MAG: aminotransferase class IV family protein [Lysobacterales bacterium]